jgi:hypothetical protein
MQSLLLHRPDHSEETHLETEPIRYKIASEREERVAAFRLVYQAYLRAGLIDANPHELRVTPYQLLPTTDVFVALCQGVVVSTVSLVGDAELGLPLEAIYGAEVTTLREQGLRFAEVSSLADRRRQLSRTLPVFRNLMRLMVQTARTRGIERLLVAVHPRHSKFYQRFLNFDPLGDEKSYPQVRNRPAVALALDFARLDRVRPVNYDTFFARSIPDDQLQRRPMSSEECHSFQEAAGYNTTFTVVGPDECEGRRSAGAA